MRLKKKMEAQQEEYDNLLHQHQQVLNEYNFMRNRSRLLQRQREEFIQTLRPILSLLQRAVDSLSGSSGPLEEYPSRYGEASPMLPCSAVKEGESGSIAFRQETPGTDLPKPTTKWTGGRKEAEAPSAKPSKGRQPGPQRSAKPAPSKAESTPRSLSATRAWQTRRRNLQSLLAARKSRSK